MKNTLRQVVVALTILATIVINILADALPINGLNTGKISDSFNVLFVPAGYVFAIWGIIYIGLIAYAVYLRLGVGQRKVSTGETWAVRVPFSIYLGWITVATVANVEDVLYSFNLPLLNDHAKVWMVIILGAVLIIAGLMNFLRRDLAYALVILWALAGIAAKWPQAGKITIAIWVTFGLVAASLAAAFLVKKNSQQMNTDKHG